jgi:hypothetical protein
VSDFKKPYFRSSIGSFEQLRSQLRASKTIGRQITADRHPGRNFAVARLLKGLTFLCRRPGANYRLSETFLPVTIIEYAECRLS